MSKVKPGSVGHYEFKGNKETFVVDKEPEEEPEAPAEEEAEESAEEG